jgi:hypothetical protein
MSFENTRLPGFVIADLYKNTLIHDPEAVAPIEKAEKVEKRPVAAEKAAPPPGYRYLGSNGRNISILVDFSNEPFLPDMHLQFLTKMLDACKLNLGDVAILNVSTTPVEIERLKNQLQPKYVLLFGVDTGSIKLPFQFPSFKEQEYAGSRYLFVPRLDELNVDTEEGKLLKSKLWVCLRKLFNV